MRWTKEMQADHILWTRGSSGDLIDVKRGGVCGEDRTRFANLVERSEDATLNVHRFVHRFDHHVDFGQRIHRDAAGDAREAFIGLGLGDAAFAQGFIVDCTDTRQPLVEAALLLFYHRYPKPSVGKTGCYARAHYADSNHPSTCQTALRCLRWRIYDLAGFPFSKEDVAQGLCFGGGI